MKIILTGVETDNKGAELMLYAILQEIERSYPNAKVYIHHNSLKQGLGYVNTKVNLKFWPLSYILDKSRIYGVLSRLHLPTSHIADVYGIRNADYLLDASGFAFSDQWDLDDLYVWRWRKLLYFQKQQRCKIIFLPQAFGPLEKKNTKELITLINHTASLVFSREKVSFDYLKHSGLISMNKVKQFSDFTSLVKGHFPQRYRYLKNGICIIPNARMLDKGGVNLEQYSNIIKSIVERGKESNHEVYLLNHEGKADENLALCLRKKLQNDIEVVTGLNALEVKGLIASAYLVVSSRFHGVASSLNSSVPCLATSWSHKYQELFKDYGLDGCVLPTDDMGAVLTKVEEFLDETTNMALRNKLEVAVAKKVEETKMMWKLVWSI